MCIDAKHKHPYSSPTTIALTFVIRSCLVHNDPGTGLHRTYCVEIAHNVSTKKQKEIVECASQLDVIVTNRLARLLSQEYE